MAESASTEIREEANTLIKNECQGASCVIDVKKKEERVPRCCIYKVPDSLYKLKREDYSPQVISIGPFHRDNKNLQDMEEYKAKYLEAFMERTKIKKEGLKSVVKDWEDQESVRQCYAETFPLISNDDFVEIILTDASFIIEFFLRNKLRQWNSDDSIVLKPWLAARLQLDLILLENQLPFFFINKLFNFAFASAGPTFPSLSELTFEYFNSYNRQEMPVDPKLEILHFVDLLRNFYLPPPPPPPPVDPKLPPPPANPKLEKLHFVDLLRNCYLPPPSPPRPCLPKRKPKTVELERMYSATQLDGVGLKFEADLSSNCLLDLHLDLGITKRVLKIPRFSFDNATELYVRNLLALEQCHYPNKEFVTDYFILLYFLINSKKDVELLRQQGILVNRFGNKHATNFFNNMGTSIISSTMSSEYYDICFKLKNFYEHPGWLEYMRRNCFSTALRLAASIALILTFIQTVCSIISVLPHH